MPPTPSLLPRWAGAPQARKLIESNASDRKARTSAKPVERIGASTVSHRWRFPRTVPRRAMVACGDLRDRVNRNVTPASRTGRAILCSSSCLVTGPRRWGRRSLSVETPAADQQRRNEPQLSPGWEPGSAHVAGGRLVVRPIGVAASWALRGGRSAWQPQPFGVPPRSVGSR